MKYCFNTVKKAMMPLLLAFVPLLTGAEFSVRVDRGIPRLMRNGEAIPNRMFFANPDWKNKEYAEATLREIGLAKDAGIDIFSFCLYDPPWKVEPSEKEFARWDAIIDRILAAYPGLLLLPRIKLDSPPFVKEDPSQLMLSVLGNRDQVSIASRRYRKEMPEVFRAAIRHLEKRYGDRIVGYQPAGAHYSEWQYRNFAQIGNLTGYDPESLIAFRSWLREKYRTDTALAKAWNHPGLTFDTAQVPSAKERKGKANLAFHNPATEQNVIDFNFFQNEDMVDAALSAARVVREECGRKKLSVIFYGYLYELAAQPNGPAVSGHYALRKMLDSPDVDIICGPFSYNNQARVPGGSEQTHTAAESIMRAGKLWLNEDDSTTPLAIRKKQYGAGDHTPERDNEEMFRIYRRNLAFGYARNYGLWWMDLHGSGWQDDPELWEEMKRFRPLERKLLADPTSYTPDVALILDENSLKYVVSSLVPYFTMQGNVTYARDRVSRASVSHGSWMLEDVLSGNVNSKLDIYCGVFALDAKQRAVLRKRAEKTVSIWCWAPGYIDLDKRDFSLDAVEELTGFKVKSVDVPIWTAFSRAYGFHYGLPVCFGWDYTVSPVLSPVPEEGDQVLAIYGNRNNIPAVVLRPGKDGKAPSLFCGTNELPPALIRHMAKLAGAHVYSSIDANIHVNGDIVAVTAPAEACYDIQVGGSDSWEDALTGEALGKGPVISRRMKRGDTVVLQKKR